MAEERLKHVPPIGSIIFIENDDHPAEMYPGTTWEPVVNNIYFITTKEPQFDIHGAPKLPYERPGTWRRLT